MLLYRLLNSRYHRWKFFNCVIAADPFGRAACAPRTGDRHRHVKADVKTGDMNFTKSLGMVALAIYLILAGLGLLIPTLAIPALIMGILAIAAGVLILIGK